MARVLTGLAPPLFSGLGIAAFGKVDLSISSVVFQSACVSTLQIDRRNPIEMKMANPFQFLQQVRNETSKVTWPTRRETLITTGLVLVMVFIASIFFLAVDWTIKELLTLLLSVTK